MEQQPLLPLPVFHALIVLMDALKDKPGACKETPDGLVLFIVGVYRQNIVDELEQKHPYQHDRGWA